MSSTLTDLTAATSWSGTDLFYALVGGNSRKITATNFLTRPAQDILEQVRSTVAQTFRVYRTYTDSSNYERLAFSSSGNNFDIKCESAGTGEDVIDLTLSPLGSGNLIINAGNSGRFKTYAISPFTNAALVQQDHYMRSIGTVAAGFGAQFSHYLENAAGSDVNAFRIDLIWDDATASSEDAWVGFAVAKGGVIPHYMIKIDATTTAGNTALHVYDVDRGALERVTVGVADSGGSGFKLLRIPN